MIWRIVLSGIGGIVGAAGSFFLAPVVARLGPMGRLFAAAFLGSLFSSLFVKTPFRKIEKEIGKGVEGKGGIMSKLKIAFWFVAIIVVIYVAVIVVAAFLK